MSKAFVNEDHEDTDDLQFASEPMLLALGDAKNYMTREGFEEMRHEIQALSDRERSREEERRLRLLLALSERAEPVDASAGPLDRVIFGSTVAVENEEGNGLTFRIVGLSEAHPEKGWISWLSPVGRALLGAKKDDAVIVRVPKGEEELIVREIR